MQGDSRVGVFAREKNIGIGFIVTQQNVVGRPVAFDQVVFKQQRIHLGRGHRNLNIAYARHQRHCLCSEASRAEIAADPVFEVSRLADVEKLAVFVVHLVDTRPAGQ